jgi:hypothetical protein
MPIHHPEAATPGATLGPRPGARPGSKPGPKPGARLLSALAAPAALAALAALAAVLLLGACGEASDGEPGPLQTLHEVEVWFSVNEEPVPARRRVGGAPLDGALRALVVGPTEEERADGMHSWFSEETRGVLRRVRAENGQVVLDFRDLPDLIPNASTSAGSRDLLMSLDSTVFQFDWVESVEYRLDGSCDAFWEWLQRECHVVTRS